MEIELSKGEKISIIGIVLVIIGSFLPWASWGAISVSGVSGGDGAVTLILGLFVGGLVLFREWNYLNSLGGFFGGSAAFLIGIVDLGDVSGISSAPLGVSVDVGIGLYFTVFGAVLMMVSGVSEFYIREDYDRSELFIERNARHLFLILAVVVLVSGSLISLNRAGASDAAGIENVSTYPTTLSGDAVLKASIVGDEGNYEISLRNPENIPVANTTVLSSEMSDGDQTVNLSLTQEGYTTPMGGNYSLEIRNSGKGEIVYENNYDFDGPTLNVENFKAYFSYDDFFETYSLDILEIKVTNPGDLPAYVTGVGVILSGDSEESPVETESVLPGETDTIMASNFIDVETESAGSHTLEIELRDGISWSHVVKEFERTVQVE